MVSSLFEMLVDQQKAALDESHKFWQREFWPEATRWIAERSAPQPAG
jgi:hypothetical protein